MQRTAKAPQMKIYVYKMTHDDGNAPCTDFCVLTQAICVPDIRKNATTKDYVMGIGGVNIGLGRINYVMSPTKIWGREYYECNRSRSDCVYEGGDKPVHRGGKFDHNIHSPENEEQYREAVERALRKGTKLPTPYSENHFLNKDVGQRWQNARVLMSTDYRYWGKNGLKFFDLLIEFKNLHSLLNLDRTYWGCGPACLVVTPSSPEWDDLLDLLQFLWEAYPPGNYGKATHPDMSPTGKDRVIWDSDGLIAAETKAVREWKRQRFLQIKMRTAI